VGEGEQGELDAELVTDLGAHGVERSENVFYSPGRHRTSAVVSGPAGLW
jgi:hypothetical protein